MAAQAQRAPQQQMEEEEESCGPILISKLEVNQWKERSISNVYV